MGEQDHYPNAFLPITQRIRAALATILDEEKARAVQEGLPGNVFLEGTLNTLLWLAARIACRIIFPAEDPESTEGRARVFRIQRAVSEAFVIVMRQEKGEAGGPDAPPWPGQQGGHA
jgi:hypothetical protein